MPKLERDGFEFYTGLYNHEIFSLKAIDLESEISYLIKNKILSIALEDSISNSLENLSFLKRIDFVEEISIGNFGIDYTGIYYLVNLKKLTVNVAKNLPDLDYSRFKNLEYLSIDWYSKFPDLSLNNKLKELVIWKFKPKSKSFRDIKLPHSLENLEITESNLLNLEGLSLPNLKKFEGHYCNSLESLSGIQDLSTSLKTLILDYCRKINEYKYLEECQNLTKLILGNCGDIENLSWLKGIKNLKHFSFYETKLLGGDTSPCFGIDYVSFKNLKYYNHKEEEFKTK